MAIGNRPFHSLYTHGYARLCVCVPRVRVAAPAFNVQATIEMARQAAADGAALALFPELGISAYSNEDLFHQDALLDATEAALARLLKETRDLPTVLINHWPLREDLIHLPRIPRYTPWCGTRATHDWHRRYRASVVVTGHLHTRRTDWIDGVRFEEVSLGYPRHWRQELGIDIHLRTILPTPTDDAPGVPRHVGAR